MPSALLTAGVVLLLGMGGGRPGEEGLASESAAHPVLPARLSLLASLALPAHLPGQSSSAGRDLSQGGLRP